MSRWWKVSLWKIVLFPALAGLITIGYSLLQGVAHRWLGIDPSGHTVDGGKPPRPPARKPIPVGEVLAAIRADLDRAEARERPRRRYLTLVHRHNEPSVPDTELQLARAALADLVAALSPPDRSATVTAIDAEQLIYRLDLDALGWSAESWRQVAVLYPYGLAYESRAEENLRTADEGIQRETGDRVPAVRADWFVVAVSRPPLGGAGGTLGLWTRTPPEKVQAVVRGYAGEPVDLDRAARELGVSSDALRQLVKGETYLQVEFGLAPLLAGKSIPRDDWESEKNLTTPFQELSKRLGLGKPIRLR